MIQGSPNPRSAGHFRSGIWSFIEVARADAGRPAFLYESLDPMGNEPVTIERLRELRVGASPCRNRGSLSRSPAVSG